MKCFIIILVAIIVLAGIMGVTKISGKECTSQPSKITLSTMRLCDVKWAPQPSKDWDVSSGKIEDLQGKKVIAILISEADDPDPMRWSTFFIIADPNYIQKIVTALEKADRTSHETLTYFSSKLQFVLEDNTGIRIDYCRTAFKPSFYGHKWVSKDLFNVFEEMFGPQKLEKKGPPPPHSYSPLFGPGK
jgi:hypothetical protein